MLSQVDLLKRALTIAEAKGGADNPFVQGLKAQIANHEKFATGQHTENPVVMSAGMRSLSVTSQPSASPAQKPAKAP